MGCISPLELKIKNSFNHNQIISVPCNHCLNCLVQKQSQIEFLSKKELLYNYRAGKSASFVTLTYDDSHIPHNENGFVTLYRKDLQLFIKRMRRCMEYHNVNKSFKLLYCGEYGDGSHSDSTGTTTHRPHYHIVFIGLSPDEVRFYTRKLWKYGLCDIGPLSAGGIRYLCKYLTKACPDPDVKAFRKSCKVENPFFYHSIGLGKQWILEHLDKIVEDDFTFNLNGKINLFPKHVMNFVSNHTGVDYRPYVMEFIKKYELPKSRVVGIQYNEYKYENDFISYKYKVAALRSQNKPVNDFTLSKKWCRPKHRHDRVPYISDLAKQAYIAHVPF